MDKELKCVVCQKSVQMVVLGEKGLNTFKECSVMRKDNFTARITTTEYIS